MSAQIAQDSENNLVIVKLPGAVLRQARERKGMTQAQIAQSLRLEISVIEALEHDDYPKLPNSTFILGYIRGYARILGMVPEPLIAEYQRIHGDEPDGKYLKHSSLKEKIGNDRRIISRSHMLVGAGVVLVAAVLLWQPWKMVPELSLPTLETEQGVSDSASDAQTITLSASTPPVAMESAQSAVSTQPQPEISSPAAMPAAVSTVDESRQAMTGNTSITLATTGDTWVQVRDAENKRLVYEMLRPGQTRTVQGIAPVDIVLGNGHNATVTVNGQPFDHSSYMAGPSARAHFKVGSSAD